MGNAPVQVPQYISCLGKNIRLFDAELRTIATATAPMFEQPFIAGILSPTKVLLQTEHELYIFNTISKKCEFLRKQGEEDYQIIMNENILLLFSPEKTQIFNIKENRVTRELPIIGPLVVHINDEEFVTYEHRYSFMLFHNIHNDQCRTYNIPGSLAGAYYFVNFFLLNNKYICFATGTQCFVFDQQLNTLFHIHQDITTCTSNEQYLFLINSDGLKMYDSNNYFCCYTLDAPYYQFVPLIKDQVMIKFKQEQFIYSVKTQDKKKIENMFVNRPTKISDTKCYFGTHTKNSKNLEFETIKRDGYVYDCVDQSFTLVKHIYFMKPLWKRIDAHENDGAVSFRNNLVGNTRFCDLAIKIE
jgi:hypothetical protein